MNTLNEVSIMHKIRFMISFIKNVIFSLLVVLASNFIVLNFSFSRFTFVIIYLVKLKNFSFVKELYIFNKIFYKWIFLHAVKIKNYLFK